MPETTVEIIPDIEEQVVHLVAQGDAPSEAAQKIADNARANAPVLSGAYAAGIIVQKTKRGARVVATDPKSAWEEFGVPTLGQPARFVLRRAAEASGLKFKKNR